MPAIPIADNRPPMVVGIKQTSSATSTVSVTGCPAPAAFTLKREKGRRVTVAKRKMIVSAASRMLSAISLGVFWRLAPSTIEIMRSRKVSPGSAPTRTTIQSESTRVPATTALRSPPALADDGCALSSDGSFVDRCHPLENLAVAGDVVARLDEHDIAFAKVGGRDDDGDAAVFWFVELLGRRVFARCTQSFGLCFAAPLGHRFGEVGEKDGEPEPKRDAENEARRRLARCRTAPARRAAS